MSDDQQQRGEYCEPCDTWYHPKEEMKPFYIEPLGKVFMMCMICYAHYDFKRRLPGPTKKQVEQLREALDNPSDV